MPTDWRRELDRLIADALGGAPGLTLELGAQGVWCGGRPAPGQALRAAGRVARARPAALPLASGVQRAVVLSLVGHAPAASDRQALLGELARVMKAGSALIVVDHNRPRRLVAALAAAIRAPRVRGRSLGARWQRLSYPAAREIQAAGFTVQWLRFAAGERLQVVLARPRAGR